MEGTCECEQVSGKEKGGELCTSNGSEIRICSFVEPAHQNTVVGAVAKRLSPAD